MKVEVWMHKLNGDIVLATPHWEALSIKADMDDLIDQELKEYLKIGNRKVVTGTLLQVGWLIQNRNNVWFGFPLSTSEQFEVLGDA